MNSKICGKCKIEKLSLFFSRNKSKKDGLHSMCKECEKIAGQIYRNSNKEKVAARKAKYHQENKEKLNARLRLYRRENKEKIKALSKKNKEKRRIQARERRRSNLNIRLKGIISSRIREFLRETENEKLEKSLILIGCSIKDLKAHLESHFEPQMSWTNYGLKGWHIDHIIPASFFDLEKIDEQLKCFNFKNLMPRWATTEIAQSYGSSQIGNINKNKYLIDSSYYFFLENPS